MDNQSWAFETFHDDYAPAPMDLEELPEDVGLPRSVLQALEVQEGDPIDDSFEDMQPGEAQYNEEDLLELVFDGHVQQDAGEESLDGGVIWDAVQKEIEAKRRLEMEEALYEAGK
jgi:hypothetical protein